MQTTTTTRTQITIPAGTIIGGGPVGYGLTLRETVTVDADAHLGAGQPQIGDDWYAFEYRGWTCNVMANRVQVVTPTPPPEPATTRTSNEIMEDVYDLMATANRMADRYGWDDARVTAIQADIERYTAQALRTAQARHAA